MRFDLIDLRLFCDIAEAGSITHGAARSRIALAAASTRVRGMEESIGAALLTRSRLGVVATPASSFVNRIPSVTNTPSRFSRTSRFSVSDTAAFTKLWE